MKKELEKLMVAHEELMRQNQTFSEHIEGLISENKQLRERVDYLVRQLFGRKSEKIDPRQLMLLLGLDEHVDPEENDTDPPPPSDPSKPRRKRRQFKDRLPEDLPVRTAIIDLPEVEADPEKYRCIGEEEHSELSMTPPVYFINKTVRRKFVQLDDRSLPPIIVPAAPRLIENSFASPEVLIDIILKKYTEHLPLYRQEQILKQRFGIELSRKTMSNWNWHIGNWLRPICDEMKEELRASEYLQVDETCIKYLMPGTGTSHQGYLWVFHSPGIGVVFEWHRGRGAKCLEGMLEEYSGDLQCDGYQAYRSFNTSWDENDRCRLFACWAHARRKFHDAKDDSIFAAEMILKIQELYRIERELRATKASHEERASRRIESKEILNDIKAILDKELLNHRPKSLTGKAISYALNLWDELIRYADTGHVEIDNNLVENCIRPTAIGKKNWLFFGSPNAGWQSAIIFSILETCRKLGIDQQEYLSDVLSQLPTLTAQEARQLTPAKWLAKRTAAVA